MFKICRLFKNFNAGLLIVLVIMTMMIIQPTSAEGDNADIIELNYSFSEPEIIEVNMSNVTYHRVTLNGLPLMNETGYPLLPMKPVRVLLPQMSIVQSLEISYKNNISLGYNFNIELGPEKSNISVEEQNELNVPTSFDYMKQYPIEIFKNYGIYNFRGYSFIYLNLYPVHYVWETGQLYYYDEITLSITTLQNGSINPLFRKGPNDEILLKYVVEDFSRLYSYNNSLQSSNSTLVNSSHSYDYVIITNENLKNSNGDYTFQDLVNYKNSKYVETTIITVEDIMNDPYYMNTTNHLFNDTQARIRNFIIDAYNNWGIEFVLIGGDINIIPVRKLFYGIGETKDEPSDLYYACLDGSFNYDEDYFWGEDTDGENSEDVDMIAEVYVGRTCVNNSEEVSNFVYKTLKYEKTFDPYIEKVLMAGESGFGNNLTYIINKFPEGWSDYNVSKLFDSEWPGPGDKWPMSEIVDRINNGINIICHIGHSSSAFNMRMNRPDVDDLTNDKHCFIYSEGCDAGYFIRDDCIAEHFTVKTDNGAFAGIWNARTGTPVTSTFFLKEFWDAIFNENIAEIGRANQDSKEDVFFNICYDKQILYGLNLFGDPEISFKPGIIPEHDVEVTDLNLKDYEHVPSNQTFKVKTFISNKGKNNETNITVNLTIDGETENTTTINIIRNTIELACFNTALVPGLHNISIEIPPLANENNTSNNLLSRTVIAGPDMGLVNLDIFPPLYINCSNYINITVGNIGTSDVSDVNISLSIDDEVVNETFISSILSGEIVKISFNWIPLQSKWYNVSAFVLPVSDENYSINNYYNSTIHPVNHSVYVDDDGNTDFTVIQDAINWIGDGDTIYVNNGMYNETLMVYKAISLIGEDKNNTIIDGNGSDYVIKIYNSNGVNISGFKIQNKYKNAIEIRSKFNNISGNIISTTPKSTSRLIEGITLYSGGNIISNNIIDNLTRTGIYVFSGDNIIYGNIITNVTSITIPTAGIFLGSPRSPATTSEEYSFNNLISNHVSENKYGIIIFSNSNKNIITENTIDNNTNSGILIYSDFNYLAKNNIYCNSNGIDMSITDSDSNSFTENNIVNNTIGIKQSRGQENVFVGNNISDNENGVNITLSSSEANNNSFHHNNFFNNTQNAYDECNNYWDNGSIGNYWDDYTGEDNDSNGIGDTPHDIPGGENQDGYPLMNMCIIQGEKPEKPMKPNGPTNGHIYESYTYNSSATDPDGDKIYYLWDWGDNSDNEWIGPNTSGCNVSLSYSWSEQGYYKVRIKVKDEIGLESDWSDPLEVIMKNRAPNKPDKPSGKKRGKVGETYGFTTKASDPDDDDVYYWFEWGDGTCTGWIGPYVSGEELTYPHTWNEKGNYEIKVKAKDDPNGDGNILDGLESPWSDPFYFNVAFNTNLYVVQKAVVQSSIQFMCNPSNGTTPYVYNWEFGDGNSSQTQNSTNTYSQTGFYTVNLTVMDDEGYSSNDSFIIEIVVLLANFDSSSSGFSKPYETIYFNDSSEGYYNIVNWTWNFDDGNISYEQNASHYFTTDGIYNVTLNITDSESNSDVYYQIIYIDSIQPEIESVSDSPDTVGFGFSITVSTNVTDDNSGVKTASVNVTYPDNSYGNFTINNIENNTYEYVFSDTWLVGQYNYTIWVYDNSNNSNSSSGHSFNVSAQADISVCTIKDSYDNNETVDLTDPPGDPPLVGYELLDNSNVLHMWNKHNSYYFNTSSGIQLTNYYDEYWSHNVLMLGYYNNDEWNLIYRTDELSGFNKDIDTDNETFVNATLWKALTYKGYDFRLAIRYNLGVNDPDLTVIPYIKNIDDEDIPYILAFGWEIKDIKIADTFENDMIRLFNGTDWICYNLNQTLDNKYTDMDYNTTFVLEGRNEGKYFRRTLYLRWNHTLDYLLKVKSREGQYNAPVTLFIKIGTLAVGQEKFTMMNWLDSDSWLGISSSELVYACENKFGLGMALDGTGELWDAVTNHDHEFILNLGKNYSIKKFRGRSNSLNDPIDVDIYISTDNSTWGTAVASDISTWQDTDTWVEVDSTDKTGRYIKVVVQSTEDEACVLAWGGFMPPGPIFDAYGEEVAVAPEVSNPYPANGSSGISLTPMLNITVYDANGDLMNITWHSNSSGSPQIFGTNNSVTDGTYRQTFSNATENGKWWYWFVEVTDGTYYIESSMYKFYTGYQSKIDNTGSTSIKGYLLIQIQFYNTTSSTWVVANDTINETTTRTIHWDDPYGDQQPILALDTIFNGLVNTNDLTYGNGTYRIYAAFRDPDGNILKCDDETELVATYEFTITF
jgi:PKD repeat protein